MIFLVSEFAIGYVLGLRLTDIKEYIVKTNELRSLFLDFFKSKDHLIEPSASLVPSADDKSLLLINAGMAPLKPYFQGIKTPPSTRIASCQRCLRTNDIDEVGRTPRHLTMFEMLGNFSFGDYFKREIITWSWEFVTEWLKIPVDKLRVSIHESDDEAGEIWEKEIGIRPDWIFRLGDEDNFWFMAETGPCGPDSEIFYDIGEYLGPDQTPATGGDRWVEIWNLVFTQFDKQSDGTLIPLPKKNVDTGMGLERTAMALQGKSSVFEADMFKPIIDVFREDTPKEILDSKKYISAGVNSLYVVSDHIRAVSMLLADGVYPGNEGRGYILRRLLRRALVHLRRLGQHESGLMKAFPVVLDQLGDTYPLLIERKDHIGKLIKHEEENFLKTLDAGVARFENASENLGGFIKLLPGEVAFEMFDTYGVPLDVTIEMAQARGMEVDEKGFQVALEAARQRSREVTGEMLDADSTARHAVKTTGETEFIGYEVDRETSSLIDFNPEHNFVVIDRTPFYAEKGGQIGDRGILRFDGGEFTIIDTQYVGNVVVHKIDPEKTIGDPSDLKPGDPIEACVDEDRRRGIKRAHTATHLLHAALREVLGKHVQQAGSVVEPDRFRFDFSHFQPLTDEETRKVEDWANERVFAQHEVNTREVPLAEAKEAGAMALFGEKYSATVRMVWVGGRETMPVPGQAQSTELCGGTHVNNTGVIGFIKIIAEESVASGVRRIEALTGRRSYEYMQNEQKILRNVCAEMNMPVIHIERGVQKHIESEKRLEREVKELERKLLSGQGTISAEDFTVSGLKFRIYPLQTLAPESVAKMLDKAVENDGIHAAFAVTDHEGKGTLMIRCSDDGLKAGLHAGNLVKDIAEKMNGRGGGRPSFARGGVDAVMYVNGAAAFKKIVGG
ncbi:MAG: alanine--tRNA ligase [bacterium]|nr:alanine--tRNA ligase [bacterium]